MELVVEQAKALQHHTPQPMGLVVAQAKALTKPQRMELAVAQAEALTKPRPLTPLLHRLARLLRHTVLQTMS